MLVFVLTGQPVYSGNSREEVVAAAVVGDLTGIRGHLASCGAEPEVVDLALRCLAIDPAERPANGGAVADWVADYRRRVAVQLRASEAERAAAKVRQEEQLRRRRVVVQATAGLRPHSRSAWPSACGRRREPDPRRRGPMRAPVLPCSRLIEPVMPWRGP